MQVLLFANGVIKPGRMLRRRLAALAAPYVLCADGGALHARAHGFTPRAVIGDLDSLPARQLAALEDAGAQILRHPADKDETDLELALRHCRRIGASSVTIIGGLGGRLDQTVANLFLLRLPELNGLPIEHVDGDQATRLLAPGRHPVAGRPGDTVSLIPITAAAGGIITSGLKYPLRRETLSMGPARGISNVMLADHAHIEFQSGLLLLVHTCGQA